MRKTEYYKIIRVPLNNIPRRPMLFYGASEEESLKYREEQAKWDESFKKYVDDFIEANKDNMDLDISTWTEPEKDHNSLCHIGLLTHPSFKLNYLDDILGIKSISVKITEEEYLKRKEFLDKKEKQSRALMREKRRAASKLKYLIDIKDLSELGFKTFFKVDYDELFYEASKTMKDVKILVSVYSNKAIVEREENCGENNYTYEQINSSRDLLELIYGISIECKYR